MPQGSLMSMSTPFFISKVKFLYNKNSVREVWTKIHCPFYFRGNTAPKARETEKQMQKQVLMQTVTAFGTCSWPFSSAKNWKVCFPTLQASLAFCICNLRPNITPYWCVKRVDNLHSMLSDLTLTFITSITVGKMRKTAYHYKLQVEWQP